MSHKAKTGEHVYQNSSQAKQSEQKHCCDGETNLHCAVPLNGFTAHLPMGTIEHLCTNADSQFVSTKKLCPTC